MVGCRHPTKVYAQPQAAKCVILCDFLIINVILVCSCKCEIIVLFSTFENNYLKEFFLIGFLFFCFIEGIKYFSKIINNFI